MVFVGTPVHTSVGEQVTIDCVQLINEVKDKGEPHFTVNWYKDGFIKLTNSSASNVFISNDERYCIITEIVIYQGGQIGNDGCYTCEVCDGTNNCTNETTGICHSKKELKLLKLY